MIEWRQAARLGLAACLLICLSACVTRGALIERSAGSPVELSDTPFFPQRIHQCGPAALATALGASDIQVTPDELAPFVYLPEKRGSLQIEMLVAPRRHGRLTYILEPKAAAIWDELNAARPVLVLHNYGLPFWPRWHYAVVIGYDPAQETFILRSGTIHRQLLSARRFMQAWDNAGRWAMVVLRPGEMPANADYARYMESAAAFERLAKPQDVQRVFEAAVKRWPQEPIAFIGRGTAYYRSGKLTAAAQDYAEALRLDPSQVGARNNLAMTLLDLGCVKQARQELEKIDASSLSDPLHEAVQDTRRQVEAFKDSGIAAVSDRNGTLANCPNGS